MKFSRSFASILACILLARTSPAKLISVSDVKRVTNLPTSTDKFMIEVDNASDIPTKRSKSKSPHERLYTALEGRDVGYRVHKEYDSQVFVGALVTLSKAPDLSALTQIEGIKAIRPVSSIGRPAPVRMDVVADGDNVDIQTTHVLTGVDKLHAEGVFGAGVKIGIIDTGVDYTHPALGGGFGPGFKVVGGYDLVGDNYTGANDPVPDDDPLDQCAGHGTHVAGIIGADPNNPYNISGVSYEASLSAYRVFGCTGFVTDDVLVDALIMGLDDGQDILTLSIGGTNGWTEGTASVVASRIAALGKIVTIAAGNDGASGSWYTSGPGNGINVISSASLDNIAIPLQNATVGGVEHNPITYYSTTPFPELKTLPIYATSNDTTIVDDACDPLPDSTPDLSPYLVIVRRGTCSFVTKLANIAAKGGTVSLIYDNGNGFVPIDVGDYNATLIQPADGEFLVQQYALGVPVTITFPQSGASYEYPNAAGGLISSFTSYGPSNDFFFKPAAAAPGGNILSTLPFNSYGLASGTSMATPFIAGAGALLLSVKGKSANIALATRSLLESTAKAISSSHTDGDPLQTVTQQGAGLINVYDAVHFSTTISPTELILNDTTHFHDTHTLTIVNTGSETKQYTITNVPAGTALTVDSDTIFPALGPVPQSADYATATFSSTGFTLQAGQSTDVTVKFAPPSGVDAHAFPVYSGFIQVASGSEIVHATYIGLAASLYDKQIIDDTDYLFGIKVPFLVNSTGDVQVEPTNYTFVGSDYPTLLFRLVFGTPAWSVDLVPADTTVTNGILAKRDSSIPAESLGLILSATYYPRNDEIGNPYYEVALTTPTFDNGTEFSEGSYRLLLRALKVTGDPFDDADYESWLSEVIGFVSDV